MDSSEIIDVENESATLPKPISTQIEGDQFVQGKHSIEDDHHSAPNTSTQNQKWQERNLKLEILLGKKNSEIQKLTETENKLKRFLALAKQRIETCKQDIKEKDAKILRIESEKQTFLKSYKQLSECNPKRILCNVHYVGEIWLLIEYEPENSDSTEKMWYRFGSESEVAEFVQSIPGEPMVVPECCLSPREVLCMKQELEQKLEHVQEEFRRYRVRAEIARKQKDTELRKIQANALATHAHKISETDLHSELDAARAQIRRLISIQSERTEDERIVRLKYENLLKDYQKLSGALGETTLASEWRERYEQVCSEKEALISKLKSGNDYLTTFLPRNRTLSGAETAQSTTTTEYLKNIVYQYLVTDQREAKEQMEKTIVTVLNFDSEERKAIEKRKMQGWFW